MEKWGLAVDAIVLGFLVLHTFLGWRRGLLWQAAGVASLGLGVGLGLLLAPALAKVAMERITSDPFRAKLVGFLLVFGLSGFTLRMAAAFFEVYVEKGLPREDRLRRRARDRILGGAFGAVKGLVMAAIVIAACVAFYPESKLWRHSKLTGSMAAAGSRLLPEGAVAEVRSWAKQHVTSISENLDIK